MFRPQGPFIGDLKNTLKIQKDSENPVKQKMQLFSFYFFFFNVLNGYDFFNINLILFKLNFKILHHLISVVDRPSRSLKRVPLGKVGEQSERFSGLLNYCLRRWFFCWRKGGKRFEKLLRCWRNVRWEMFFQGIWKISVW